MKYWFSIDRNLFSICFNFIDSSEDDSQAVIAALREGVIAPTIGYEEPDPECALDVVPNVAREARVDAVLSNAFAFGGLNAVIALRRV